MSKLYRDISLFLTKEFLTEEYVNKKRSAAKIAKQIGVGQNTISKCLSNFGLLRPLKKFSFTEDYLRNEYLINDKDCATIAKENKCSDSVISKWLTKFNIVKDFKRYPDNKKFGKLTIKGISHRHKTQYVYNCKCDCGNFSKVKHFDFPKTKTCGCGKHPLGENNAGWTGFKEISGGYISSLKRNAKNRNLEWDITLEYIWNLFIQQNRRCAISGEELSFGEKRKGKTASLDRIENNKGYIPGNVQWTHKDINWMKGTYTQDEFINWSHKISNYQINKYNYI